MEYVLCYRVALAYSTVTPVFMKMASGDILSREVFASLFVEEWINGDLRRGISGHAV
jgi:hypothetical protein